MVGSSAIYVEEAAFGGTDALIIWIIAIIAFLAIEAKTINLITIWFVLGAVIAAILSLFNIAFGWQILAFIFSTAILLIFTRPLVKKLQRKGSSTNKDTIIGKSSFVTEKIDNLNQTGYVKINDVFWTARSYDDTVIEEGVLVEVKEIKGNKLIVAVKSK